ncbi:cellulose biosynthesis cyclic di-GMP-binding regulatory protein BcsB [Paenibacillus donghaensis]|uniref:Cellulose synthase n=1 Tax=Paenibacillus donghaensis TaxID=414771 RepID=A0A2Z2KUF1_9BACL|nr:cellulose biosynthesis cyclic di-GMP-binding regulatory protein BcsB [Paenibacillus donghaensis]ASA24681.1 cellulose synthase [Paenibacillus donghaensis]
MKKQMAIWTLCLSLFFIQLQTAGAAPAPQDGRMSYETAFTGTDTSLTGSGSRQQYFEVMDYWNVDELRINLSFQVSQITDEQDSSITLSLNGSPFHTFRPKLGNDGKQQLSIPAPKGFLKKGTNTLSIQGYLRTTAIKDQLCYVDNAPDNWLHLFNTSSVQVLYTNQALDGGIRDFTQRFSGIDTLQRAESILTVPEGGTGAELEAAAYALSGFVQTSKLKEKPIPLLPYRADTVKDKQAVVLVAMYDRVPAALKAQLSKQDDLGGHALIQLVHAAGQPTLVVTSKDESLLIKAGRLLANAELTSQISSELKVVDDTTEVATPPLSISSTITFTETGDKLSGPYHQEQTYFVSLPSNRSLADSGRISLDYRYAQNLDFDRSLVTVSINDTPIGSKKLAKELANGDTLNFTVPKSLNISGNFSVTVAFDLELAGAICTPNTEQMPWAYISKDSVLQLNTKDRTDLLFNNYPYPFLRDEIFNHVAVVLPQEMDDYSFLSLSNVFNLLGQYASGNTGDIHFYSDSVSEGNLSNNNIIAIGSYSNNKLIRDNNDKLYFRFSKDGSRLVSNEKMSIEDSYGAQLGTLQLIESPYASGRGLLAVTGASTENAYVASRLIASEKDKWKVFGDGVAADKDGNVSAHRFKTISGAADDSIVRQVIERSDVVGFIAALLLVLTLVLVSLILLLRKHMKKRGDGA